MAKSAIPPVPVRVITTEPVANDLVPFLRELLGKHGGGLIQNAGIVIDLDTGFPQEEMVSTSFLFPPGTMRCEIWPRISTARSDIRFPDGYRLYEVSRVHIRSLLFFPEEDIPEMYRERIGHYRMFTSDEKKDDNA